MNLSHYGRKWLLEIKCTDGKVFSFGNDGFSGKESLKCVFDVNYPGCEGWYFSEFTIYNPAKETEKVLIGEGDQVFFYAGYQNGNYDKIFGGRVFQPLYSRENVTDYKLTLICMDGERLFRGNFTSFTLAKYRRRTLLNQIAARSFVPIEVGEISKQIKDYEVGEEEPPEEEDLSRGVSLMGTTATFMREYVKTNGGLFYVKDDRLEVVKIEDAPTGDYIEITRNNGLVGTPQQTDGGISFRTLLNPQLKLTNPFSWVKLDMSQISVKQQKAVYGKPLAVLPVDGYFKIGGIRHTGDTRGDEWYTDVMGYSLAGKAPLQLVVPQMLNREDGTDYT